MTMLRRAQSEPQPGKGAQNRNDDPAQSHQFADEFVRMLTASGKH